MSNFRILFIAGLVFILLISSYFFMSSQNNDANISHEKEVEAIHQKIIAEWDGSVEALGALINHQTSEIREGVYRVLFHLVYDGVKLFEGRMDKDRVAIVFTYRSAIYQYWANRIIAESPAIGGQILRWLDELPMEYIRNASGYDPYALNQATVEMLERLPWDGSTAGEYMPTLVRLLGKYGRKINTGTKGKLITAATLPIDIQNHGWPGKLPWNARLALARIGDENFVTEILQQVQSEDDIVTRATILFKDLTYIRHPKVTQVLANFVFSNKLLPSLKPMGPGISEAYHAVQQLNFLLDGRIPVDESSAWENVLVARAWLLENAWNIEISSDVVEQHILQTVRAIHDVAQLDFATTGATTVVMPMSLGWSMVAIRPDETSGSAVIANPPIVIGEKGNWEQLSLSLLPLQEQLLNGSYSWKEPLEDVYSPFSHGGVILFRPELASSDLAYFGDFHVIFPSWATLIPEALERYQVEPALQVSYLDSTTRPVVSVDKLESLTMDSNDLIGVMAVQKLINGQKFTPAMLHSILTSTGTDSEYRRAVVMYSVIQTQNGEGIRNEFIPLLDEIRKVIASTNHLVDLRAVALAAFTVMLDPMNTSSTQARAKTLLAEVQQSLTRFGQDAQQDQEFNYIFKALSF
ncbi:MAG: hypothetical protein AAB415_00630 [Patescibacteria group bacterium]